MIKNDCTYCKHSYLPCDEIFCLRHKEPNTCGDNYELDEYFENQIQEYNEELKDGMNK